MKKITIYLLFLLLTANVYSRNASALILDELYISEHWVSLTKSYDIETKTQKLGSLYRRFFSLLLTYDFYNHQGAKTATAKARFFSFGVTLDIYDASDSFIGSVEEKIFTFFPTFVIFAPDSSTKLAYAAMNFWGTKFYLYDPATQQEMAIMSRSFFRLKNNWTIHVTNKALLEEKNIDPRVLMTVLAAQGEIEEWKKDRESKVAAGASTQDNLEYTKLAEKINEVTHAQGLDKFKKADPQNLEKLADELEQQFHAEYPLTGTRSDKERTNAFIDYCFHLIEGNSLPDKKKKDILTLLNLRLKGHN